MTDRRMTVDLEGAAVERFASWCLGAEAKGPPRLVADTRTWAALGIHAAEALESRGLSPRRTILDIAPLQADGEAILRLMLELKDDDGLLVAAGSGTITDLVRFVAAKTGRDFVSLPSAPSVDAWASSVAALVVGGTKLTLPAKPPLAIFADPAILAAAPPPMIAAGFGDLLCKFTAVADWRLGAFLWDEPYDEALALRSLAAAERVRAAAEAIGDRSGAGIKTLMEGLVDSGLCMAAAGHSRPASGAEHHYSHFWEEAFLSAGRPPLLHGLKVALGTLISAGLWEAVGALSKEGAASRLTAAAPRARDREVLAIKSMFGARAEGIIEGQERFLELEGDRWDELRKRILENWDRIRRIAAGVPGAAALAASLARAGCPTEAGMLGISDGEMAAAVEGAHWLRDRFTVAKLGRMLSIGTPR